MTIGGIIADIFSLNNLWNGFVIWIILGIFSAMTYYPMRNLPRENFGVDIRDFFSKKEKAEIKKSLKPWILALAIAAAIFALLIFLNPVTV